MLAYWLSITGIVSIFRMFLCLVLGAIELRLIFLSGSSGSLNG